MACLLKFELFHLNHNRAHAREVKTSACGRYRRLPTTVPRQLIAMYRVVKYLSYTCIDRKQMSYRHKGTPPILEMLESTWSILYG